MVPSAKTGTIKSNNNASHYILPANSTLFRDLIKGHDKCHLCGKRQTFAQLLVTYSEIQFFCSLLTKMALHKRRYDHLR